MKVYFLQLLLTKKCNQKCYYCNVYPLTEYDSDPEVDLEFLQYVLRCIPNDTMIELTGGEIGLISNLDRVFDIVNSNNKVKLIQVMSNGLVRLKGYGFIKHPKVRYREHLIKEIDQTYINKFYDNLCFEPNTNWRYVIVTTEKTIKSFYQNFEYFRRLGFFEDMFWYKLMNPKTKSIDSFIPLLENFYKKLDNIGYREAFYALKRIKDIKTLSSNLTGKRMSCGWCSPTPSVDFEKRQLIHCGTYLEDSYRVEYTPNNFDEHLSCSLFKSGPYCDKCYVYEENRTRFMMSCRSGQHYNLEVQ